MSEGIEDLSSGVYSLVAGAKPLASWFGTSGGGDGVSINDIEDKYYNKEKVDQFLENEKGQRDILAAHITDVKEYADQLHVLSTERANNLNERLFDYAMQVALMKRWQGSLSVTAGKAVVFPLAMALLCVALLVYAFYQNTPAQLPLVVGLAILTAFNGAIAVMMIWLRHILAVPRH